MRNKGRDFANVTMSPWMLVWQHYDADIFMTSLKHREKTSKTNILKMSCTTRLVVDLYHKNWRGFDVKSLMLSTINLTKLFRRFVWSTSLPWFWQKLYQKLHRKMANLCPFIVRCMWLSGGKPHDQGPSKLNKGNNKNTTRRIKAINIFFLTKNTSLDKQKAQYTKFHQLTYNSMRTNASTYQKIVNLRFQRCPFNLFIIAQYVRSNICGALFYSGENSRQKDGKFSGWAQQDEWWTNNNFNYLSIDSTWTNLLGFCSLTTEGVMGIKYKGSPFLILWAGGLGFR